MRPVCLAVPMPSLFGFLNKSGVPILVVAKVRKVAIGVVFKKFPDGIRFLLLRRKRGWRGWEFPKGGVEKNETWRDAATRETGEETGLKRLRVVKRVGMTIKYNYPKNSSERADYESTRQWAFLIEALDDKVKIERDFFSGHAWLGAKDAINRLKWDNQRDLLRMVLKEMLSKH